MGIICTPWLQIGLTEHPNSKWAEAHPAHLLTASLITRTAYLNLFWKRSFLKNSKSDSKVNISGMKLYHLHRFAISIWADKFWDIWGIFGQFISIHFGTVSTLSMFFIKSTIIFTKKPKPLYLNPEIFLGLGLVI